MAKKKKILFLLEAFDKGGIEQVTLDIVNQLDLKKYDITVQTFWYGGHCQSLVNPAIKVKPFFFKRPVRGMIRLIAPLPAKWLHRLFIRGKYDVEIAASDGGAAKVISGCTRKKTKKICWVHMDVKRRGSQMAVFQNPETAKEIYEKFDVIAPVSQTCKKIFAEKFGQDYPYCVVHNPMKGEEIAKKSTQKQEIPFSDVFNFVCVGRLEEQKGFDRLLDACKQVKEELSVPFHIYIAGEGGKREQLENTAKEYGLADTVTFLGFCPNPYPYIKNADAFLLSSRDEAYPLAVGESIIVGTPVVATDCCGVSEWLNDGAYGLTVENSVDGIVYGMKEALQKPEILQKYRERLPQARAKISFEKAMAEFEELLK